MYKKMDLGISLWVFTYKCYHQTDQKLKYYQVSFNCTLCSLLAETRLSCFTTVLFSLFNRRLHLYLPRISISGSYDVKDLFMEMGITDVFSSNADLSGISGSRTLQVSQVSGWTDIVMGWLLVFLINFISKSHDYVQGLP